MVFSLKHDQIEDFKTRYRRNCDVLLLEEVHFLAGKQKTQLELGRTLDALSNGNKKIIFTSSLLPKNISNMSRELSSRLTSGIITSIESPDYTTRVKILEKKALEQDIALSEEITFFLAKHLTGDVRQMESVLRCLKAKTDLLRAKISLNLVQEMIKCHVSGDPLKSTDEIKELVCQFFKVDPTMLGSKSRKKIHSYPRNIYAYLCRNYSNETLENIGRSINRNHSTVLYASEIIERRMRLDQKVKNQVHFLGQRLKKAQSG
jgi:chromosomal replication initiator protein